MTTTTQTAPFIPACYAEHGVTAATINGDADVAEAREAVAARLEHLARRVRAGSTTDVQALDAAYSAIVKLAADIKGIF